MTKRAACAVVDLTTTSEETASTPRRKKARASCALGSSPPVPSSDGSLRRRIRPRKDVFAWSPGKHSRDDAKQQQDAIVLLDHPDGKPAAARPRKKEDCVVHIIDDDEKETPKGSRGSPIELLEGKQSPADSCSRWKREKALKRSCQAAPCMSTVARMPPAESPEDVKGDEALARQLEKEWNEQEAAHKALEATQKVVAGNAPMVPMAESPEDAKGDEALARRLQEEWKEQEASRKALEETQMQESVTGKALELVKGVLQIQGELMQEIPCVRGKFNCVARDDMVFMAEATLQERLTMEALGKPIAMDVGYHFTRPANMVHIRTGGLLTLQDRNARGITANFNGAAFGDGIYTANDTTYAGGGNFGDTGLLVARLKGVESKDSRAIRGSTVPHDTFVQSNVVVLRQSSQCLAMLEFDRSLLSDPTQAKAIWAAHVKLQQLLDKCLNGSDHAIAPTLRPPNTLPLLNPAQIQAAQLQHHLQKQAVQWQKQAVQWQKQAVQLQKLAAQQQVQTAQQMAQNRMKMPMTQLAKDMQQQQARLAKQMAQQQQQARLAKQMLDRRAQLATFLSQQQKGRR